MSANIPLPRPMDVETREALAKNWKMFRREWEDYEVASDLEAKPDKVRVSTLRMAMGRDCVEILENLDLSEGQKKKTKSILEALGQNFEPQANVIYERSVFYTASQEKEESINQYVNRLRRFAASCEFTPSRVHEEAIRDRLVLGVIDKQVRKQLIKDSKLTLTTAISLCNAAEQSDIEMAKLEVNQKEAAEAVHFTRKYTKIQDKKTPDGKKTNNILKKCRFCGQAHQWSKFKCPAFNKTCTNCKKLNHTAEVCRQKQTVHAAEHSSVEYDEEEDF